MSTGDIGGGLLVIAWAALCSLGVVAGLVFLLAAGLLDIGTPSERRIVAAGVVGLAAVGPGLYFWRLQRGSGP